MTSNIGSEYLVDVAQDEAKVTERVLAAMKEKFRPEFINRIDDIVIFHSLKEEQLGAIVDIQLRRMEKLLERRKLRVEVNSDAKKLLAKKGWDPVYGARPLKRAIQKYLIDPLSSAILEGRFKEGDLVKVSAGKDELILSK